MFGLLIHGSKAMRIFLDVGYSIPDTGYGSWIRYIYMYKETKFLIYLNLIQQIAELRDHDNYLHNYVYFVHASCIQK